MQLLRSKLTLVVALAVVLAFGILMVRTYARERAVRQDVKKLTARIAQADAKNQELAQLIERFSQVGEIEKEARVRLNLKRPDEEVLVIPSAMPKATTPQSDSVAAGRAAQLVPSTPEGGFTAVQKTSFSLAPIANFFRSLFKIF